MYVAQVKERAAARKIYDAAKKQGKTAGLVATKLVFYLFIFLLFYAQIFFQFSLIGLLQTYLTFYLSRYTLSLQREGN